MVKNRAGNAIALKGGCFCGAIRYAASGTPFHETNCHCAICRRTTGAPFVTWFSVPRTGFRFVRGTPNPFSMPGFGIVLKQHRRCAHR